MVSNDLGDHGVALPGILLLISAGSLVTLVLLVAICTCCRKQKIPRHKAEVKKNVVATAEMKSNSLGYRTPVTKRGRPPSMIFEGTPIGSGRWDDMSHIGKAYDIPVKYRQEKPERPPNPPDVIMHPALISALRKEQRPQSTIVLSTPLSPATQRSGPQPSTSLEDLIRQYEPEKPETPLSRYPVRSEETKEKIQDGSILYYRPKKDFADAKPMQKLQESRHVTRTRIRSNGDTPTVKLGDTSHTTPSESTPQERSSGEWDNVPKNKYEEHVPPPLPTRNYTDSENEDVHTQVAAHNASKVGDKMDAIPSSEKVVIKRTHNYENTKPASLESNSQPRSPSPKRMAPSNGQNAWQKQRYAPHESPSREGSFHGSENRGFVQDSPQRQMREYRNVQFHPNSPGYRQQDADVRGRPPQSDSHIEDRQRRQRHPRVNDLRQDGIPVSNYSPDRVQITPGVYLRPKPYYPYAGIHDHGKRYSDASDYSDLMYDRTSYYAERASREYDPYFFRSRWSVTPEPPSDYFRYRRRNSDFVVDDFDGFPRDQEQRKQHVRRSFLESEHEGPKAYPKREEVNGAPPPVYRMKSSRSDEADYYYSRNHAMQSSPPQSSYNAPRMRQRPQPRNQQTQNRAQQQENRLSDIPFRYIPPDSPRSISPPRRRTRDHRPLDIVEERHHEDVRPQYFRSPYASRESNSQPQDVTREHPSKRPQRSKDGTPEHLSIPTTPSLLAPPSPQGPRSSRSSSDYGSLIDVMYRYRQNVRKSREKEKPTESPESRLRFEREKLKTKLQNELEPRHTASKNLDLVVDTLLYLCETENTVNKRSWQRDHTDQLKSKSRPNSAILLTPSDDRSERMSFTDTDAATKDSDDYAQVKSKSLESIVTQRTLNSVTSVTDSSDILNGSKIDNLDMAVSGRSKNSDIPEYSKVNKRKIKKRHDYYEIDIPPPKTAPPDSAKKEFAFPTEEELNRILKQEQMRTKTPPPVPPRRNRHIHTVSQQEDDTPPPISPRKFEVAQFKYTQTTGSSGSSKLPEAQHPQSPQPSHILMDKPIASIGLNEQKPHREAQPPQSSHSSHILVDKPIKSIEVNGQKPPVVAPRKRLLPAVPSEVPQAEIKEQNGNQGGEKTPLQSESAEVTPRQRSNRRRSLPSMHLTENELQWLQRSGGKKEDVSKSHRDEKRNEPRFKSTRVRRKDSTAFVLPRGAKMVAKEIPIEEVQDEKQDDAVFNFEDMTGLTDAEDIIKEVERRMSQRTPTKSPPTQSPYKSNPQSDSEMGTWSSVASSELSATPARRAHLYRSEGKHPSFDNSPVGSPVFTKRSPYTPPPVPARNTNSPPVPIRNQSLSPVRKNSVFQTPPTSPLVFNSSPVAVPKKSSSVTNIFATVTQSPVVSPKIKPQPPAPQFTPRKQHRPHDRPVSPRMVGLHRKVSISAPASPAITGPRPSLARRSSRHMAKIPFIGRKFVQSTSEHIQVVPIESDRRRISRTGGIVILPADDDYADPLDCIHPDEHPSSPHFEIPISPRIINPLQRDMISPNHDNGFYPIREDNDFDDYAFPINSTPNLLLKQRMLSRSMEMLDNVETAV